MHHFLRALARWPKNNLSQDHVFNPSAILLEYADQLIPEAYPRISARIDAGFALCTFHIPRFASSRVKTRAAVAEISSGRVFREEVIWIYRTADVRARARARAHIQTLGRKPESDQV